MIISALAFSFAQQCC